jgi:peptidoglycan hydrolase CwlO-like protein
MNAVVLVVEPECRPGSVHRQQVVDMDETAQVQIARVESTVQHILTQVADIKIELRRTNDRIDKLDAKLDAKIDGVEKRLTEKNDILNTKIDGVRQDLASMKIWAMGMYVTLSGSLLFVMAKGFHWV